MAGLRFDTCTGALTINSVSMHCAAWCLSDLTELWAHNRPKRGENTVVDGLAGRAPNPLYPDQAHHSLPFAWTGEADMAGVGPANLYTQLQANVDYLLANVVDPSLAAPVAASLIMPSGATRTATIQVVDWLEGAHVVPHFIEGTLEIMVIEGAFA